MDDDNAVQSDADNAYEFISEGELRSFSDDANELNSLDSGVPLSSVESTLAKRVRDLKKENKEIRYAVDNYQEALQVKMKSLHIGADIYNGPVPNYALVNGLAWII